MFAAIQLLRDVQLVGAIIASQRKRLDLAERLPLPQALAEDAMLIEPTETESKETLDDFIGTMLELAETSQEDLEEAPTHAPTRRLDETRAARQLKARW